jgi:hypothetical protein
MFYNCYVEDLAQRFEDCGVTFDTSKCGDIYQMFGWYRGKRVPRIDCSSAMSQNRGAQYLFANTPELETIDALVLQENTSLTSTFNNCPKLKNITIEGTSLMFGNRGENDAIIIGFDVNGLLVFYSSVGGAYDDVYSTVAIDDGRIYVLGTTFNTLLYVKDGGTLVNANVSNQDAVLVIYDMNGKVVDHTFVSGKDDEMLTSITFTDNQIIVAGTTNSEKLEPSAKSSKPIKITGKSEDSYVAYVLHIQKENLVINSASEVDGSTKSIESIVVNEKSNDITYLGVTINASMIFTQHTLVAEDINLVRNGKVVNIESDYRYKDVAVYLDGELVDSTENSFNITKKGEYKVVITDFQGGTIIKTITINSLGASDGSITVGLIGAFIAVVAIMFVLGLRVYKARKKIHA